MRSGGVAPEERLPSVRSDEDAAGNWRSVSAVSTVSVRWTCWRCVYSNYTKAVL